MRVSFRVMNWRFLHFDSGHSFCEASGEGRRRGPRSRGGGEQVSHVLGERDNGRRKQDSLR